MTRSMTRRSCLATTCFAGVGWANHLSKPCSLEAAERAARQIRVIGMKVTPIALPDPPLLAAGGCHGPYFLRNVVELKTDAGIVGVGETHGGESVTQALEGNRARLIGSNAAAYLSLSADQERRQRSAFAALEVACLDVIGQATGLRVCELLGGPVRTEVEFASYLFFRYAADHARVLDDPRLVDSRGKGGNALDDWGDVRSVESMAQLAKSFRDQYGFRVHKLKAGVFSPEMELETLKAIHAEVGGNDLLRIDPNGRWSIETALRIGEQLRDLPLEYYEDPVAGQTGMAQIRKQLGLPTSTNGCVTAFEHIPSAIRTEPIDVVLGDHHVWGGLTGFQTLGRISTSLGWGLSQHSNNHAGVSMAAMIHAGASIPELTLASDTHYVWLPPGADIIEGPNLPLRDGKMMLPKTPGLGVRLDQDKLARAHEVYRKSGMRRRNDAQTMRRFIPEWRRDIL